MILVLIFSTTWLVLDITEINLFARNDLKTITYLICQCVKIGLWLIILIFGDISALHKQISGSTAGRSEGRLAGGDTVLLCFQLSVARRLADDTSLEFAASLIYAGVIFHRKRLIRRRRSRGSDEQHPPRDKYNNGRWAKAKQQRPDTTYSVPSVRQYMVVNRHQGFKLGHSKARRLLRARMRVMRRRSIDLQWCRS